MQSANMVPKIGGAFQGNKPTAGSFLSIMMTRTLTFVLRTALPEIWDKMATDMRTLTKYGDQILL